jgi:uncharacterized protein YehS (DUF1456 family)
MDLTVLKNNIAAKLKKVEDETLLEYINTLLGNNNKEDIFEQMPDEVLASFEQGVKEADNGEGVPHTEVMEKYAKWLKK